MQKIWIFLNSWLHPVSIILKKVLGVLFPLGWDLMDSGMTNVQMQVERWTVSRRVKILVDFEVVGIRLKSKLCNQLNVKSSLATCVKLCAKAYGQWQSKVWNTFFFVQNITTAKTWKVTTSKNVAIFGKTARWRFSLLNSVQGDSSTTTIAEAQKEEYGS